MRIIIAGGRDFKDYQLLKSKCGEIIDNLFNEGLIDVFGDMLDIEIVSGGATGADQLGERFAKEIKFEVRVFPANWYDLKAETLYVKFDKNGKEYNALAGKVRNEEMAKYAKEDNGALILAWDGKSPGSKNMMEIAKKYKLKVFIIKY